MSIDHGQQQIAFDSAPVAKVDRRKLLQYTYLLQEDASNKHKQSNKDNESMDSNRSDQE